MKKQWWKEAIVYQVYPRSFYDTNSDGTELNMVFQFEHVSIDYSEYGKYTTNKFQLKDLAAVMSKWQEFLRCVYNLGRDNARTPMQWEDSSADFCIRTRVGLSANTG